MTLMTIPIRHPVHIREAAELGTLSIGAQVAIMAGVSLASTAITTGFQYYAARKKKKEDEKRIKEEQARAAELARQAQLEEQRVQAEIARLQQEAQRRQQLTRRAQQQAAAAQARSRSRNLLLWSALGLGALGLIGAGIFLVRKRAKNG